MLYGIVNVHFFLSFFRRDFVWVISLEPLLAETPNWLCCLLLRSNFALLLTIQFASLFFFFTTILSGPYLWNPYSQTPNWVCCLILWSNFALAYHSVRFVSFFFFFSAKILSGPYLWNRYSQILQIECAAWSCSLIVHCCLPSNLFR